MLKFTHFVLIFNIKEGEKMGSVRKKGNSWYYTIEMAPVDGKRKRVERVAKGAKTKKEAMKIMLEVENELK